MKCKQCNSKTQYMMPALAFHFVGMKRSQVVPVKVRSATMKFKQESKVTVKCSLSQIEYE